MTQAIYARPMVSPLRYPGGKGALFTRLKAMIRSNDLTRCTYVEPYAGGAGAALGLLAAGQVNRIVLNDLDPAIYSLWLAITKHPKDFASRVRSTVPSLDEWHRQKAVQRRADFENYFDLGFSTFFLNRTNRSGVLNAGPIGGLDQTGNYKIDARYNANDLAERVRIIGLYASRIRVSSVDGKAVIKRYAEQKKSFIYADPPYFNKAGSLYMNTFEEQDHSSLAVMLNSYSSSRWILTYDDVPQVHDLYSQRRRRRFDLNYSAYTAKKATEVLVVSDAMENVSEGWPV
ncbi:DNA adenine methylase [Mycobacteroides abscessus]|uniref:DNA adenine methylase n=1 Tax=Mycobacteroides abscessus TaxID=36809 RepID=UPI003AF79487